MQIDKRVLCGGLLTAVLMGFAAQAAAGDIFPIQGPNDPIVDDVYYCSDFGGDAGNPGGGQPG
ncbi:hypothetical protein [Paraburkholderia mimosarum]|uniref:hypothetical protein n=1 Tax=Paraburkholderia mimosarum TaxID=312026 RepID=UPI000481D010|nr:hypothetical protein [Paraburkholderia mimosarum]